MIINMITALLKGGGAETESGTWSPTSNAYGRGTIDFSKTHSKPPSAFIVWDATSSTPTSNSSIWVLCVDAEALFGTPLTDVKNDYLGYRIGYYYTGSSYGVASGVINHSGSESGDSGVTYYRYHANESCIKPMVGNYYLWSSNRTYKWVAIWT